MEYQWTTNDDEVPFDAVIVGIGGTSSIMLSAGLSYVEPTASICWPDWYGPTGIVKSGGEMGPWLVPEALKRAAELREHFGFLRVVVTMEERGLWRDEWGSLAEDEGYD